jgi:hypothetical protein
MLCFLICRSTIASGDWTTTGNDVNEWWPAKEKLATGLNHSEPDLTDQDETQVPQHSESTDHLEIRVVDASQKVEGPNKPSLLVPGNKRFPLIDAQE